eukprot:TRINITY_DN72926_c0_g1_i1.p1 TRINITY_DN72926_c0_g1~~TRINITY_DN72926_c0_g1_i1.p1  ORF type:complete len:230 (+),score=23.30 TRINITY_DN72926_c0_g1_i1:74-691(+)
MQLGAGCGCCPYAAAAAKPVIAAEAPAPAVAWQPCCKGGAIGYASSWAGGYAGGLPPVWTVPRWPAVAWSSAHWLPRTSHCANCPCMAGYTDMGIGSFASVRYWQPGRRALGFLLVLALFLGLLLGRAWATPVTSAAAWDLAGSDSASTWFDGSLAWPDDFDEGMWARLGRNLALGGRTAYEALPLPQTLERLLPLPHLPELTVS